MGENVVSNQADLAPPAPEPVANSAKHPHSKLSHSDRQHMHLEFWLGLIVGLYGIGFLSSGKIRAGMGALFFSALWAIARLASFLFTAGLGIFVTLPLTAIFAITHTRSLRRALRQGLDPAESQPGHSPAIAITSIVLFGIAALSIFIPSHAGITVYATLLPSANGFPTSSMALSGFGIVLATLGGLIAAIIAVVRLPRATAPARLLKGFAGTALGAAIIGMVLSVSDMVRFINGAAISAQGNLFAAPSGIYVAIGLFLLAGILALVQLIHTHP
jgi:hypothetical protein